MMRMQKVNQPSACRHPDPRPPKRNRLWCLVFATRVSGDGDDPVGVYRGSCFSVISERTANNNQRPRRSHHCHSPRRCAMSPTGACLSHLDPSLVRSLASTIYLHFWGPLLRRCTLALGFGYLFKQLHDSCRVHWFWL